MTRPALLEVRDLEIVYGDVVAVDGASLTADGPGITALLGPSGCGKTSLLRAVAGFESPRRGRVLLAGEEVAGPDRWVDPEHRQVGMVFQQGALFPHLDVAANVRYGVAGRPDAARRVARVLDLVGLAGLAHRYPDELSGGQQQRVALARALAPSPRLVLLDEPFAALDAALRERVRREVAEILAAARLAAVLVTHDQEEAFSVADRVAVMDRGRILQVGTPEEIYHRPASLAVARFVGGGHLVDCRAEAGAAESAYGRARVEGAEGRAWMFVRPEDFRIEPEDGAVGDNCFQGVRATVTGRRFYGHDVLDRVATEAGDEVEVRVLSSAVVPVGARVRVSLRGRTFRAFPVEG